MGIRNANESDLDAMLAIYAPYVLNTTFTLEYEVPGKDEFRKRFLEHTAILPWLVYEENGEILGYAYAGRPFSRAGYSWAAELSIYVSQAAHRRGIGKMLYGELEKILCTLGYRTVYAIVTGENENSIRFHEKLGYRNSIYFEKIAYKFGRCLGVHWLEKRLCDEEPAPEDFPGIYRK